MPFPGLTTAFKLACSLWSLRNPEQVKTLLNEFYERTVEKHKLNALDDPDPKVRLSAVCGPHVTEAVRLRALDNDQEPVVSLAAIHHANPSPAVLIKALQNPYPSVSDAARRHANITRDILTAHDPQRTREWD
jgi:hypothetical protein